MWFHLIGGIFCILITVLQKLLEVLNIIWNEFTV